MRQHAKSAFQGEIFRTSCYKKGHPIAQGEEYTSQMPKRQKPQGYQNQKETDRPEQQAPQDTAQARDKTRFLIQIPRPVWRRPMYCQTERSVFQADKVTPKEQVQGREGRQIREQEGQTCKNSLRKR